MKNSKAGTILMIIGSFLIVAALILVVYNKWEDTKAGEEAAEIASILEQQMPSASDLETRSIGLTYLENDGQQNLIAELDGNCYIGLLELPTLSLTLPVSQDWSYPKLRIAPCRYEGSVAQGDLIIAGHNYASHFGLLKNLSYGDSLRFTDIEGKVYSYTVSQLETVGKHDMDVIKQGEWDLTLFTCTVGGTNRIVVRCTLADQIP